MLEELAELLSKHEVLTKALETHVETCLRRISLNGKFEVRGRVKTFKSAREKIDRKGYESLTQLRDLTGIRVLVNFEDDVGACVEAIKDAMKGDIEVTKEPNRANCSFWYASTHLEGTLNSELGHQLGLADLVGLPYDIQIRSPFQHAWADVEHGLNYKAKTKLPPHIERKLAQLAALVEIGDQLLIEARSLKMEFQRRASENPAGSKALPIDVESLSWYVRQEQLARGLDSFIAELRGLDVMPFDEIYMDKVATALGVHEYESLQALEDAINQQTPNFQAFLTKYNSRDRVKRRHVLPGLSLELFAEFLAMGWPPSTEDSLISYYRTVHGWPLQKAQTVARRLFRELRSA